MDTLLRQVIHYKSIDSLDVCLVKSIRLPPSGPPCRFPPRISRWNNNWHGGGGREKEKRGGRRAERGGGRQSSRVTRINYVRPLAFKSLFNCKRRRYLLAPMIFLNVRVYSRYLSCRSPSLPSKYKLKRFRVTIVRMIIYGCDIKYWDTRSNANIIFPVAYTCLLFRLNRFKVGRYTFIIIPAIPAARYFSCNALYYYFIFYYFSTHTHMFVRIHCVDDKRREQR